MPSLGSIALSQPWLIGSLLSVVASAVGLVGLALQKAAQHLVEDRRARLRKVHGPTGAGARDDEDGESPAPLQDLMRTATWWLGLAVLAAQYPVTMLALSYAPETTVVSLGAIQVVLNFPVAYGLLSERFTRKDMWATAVCVAGMVVAVASMPRNVPGYMENFPTKQFLQFCDSLLSSSRSNEGFASYLLTWLVLLAVCVYLLLSISKAKVPYALPLLVGLFTSQFHFVAKLAGTLAHRSGQHPEVWQPATYWIMATTAVLYAVSLCVTSVGLRHLDCRFFVPATFAAGTVLMVAQGLFFFREWQLMSSFDLVFFTLGCAVSFAGAIFVSPVHSRAPIGGPSSPLLPPQDGEVLRRQRAVLSIMEEHRMLHPEATRPRPLETISLESPQTGIWAVLRAIWRWVPISACTGVLALCAALYENNFAFIAFFILTIWGAHNGWKYGLHMALFSYVGQRKMAQYEEVDFLDLHEQCELQARQLQGSAPRPRWGEVRHYVLLPNYKEDVAVLRLAIRSVAASRIAAKQIGIVLAMEAREEGVEAKAAGLVGEFAGLFWQCVVTYHPPGLPGETPGKSSNVKWAAQQVLDCELALMHVDPGNVVITVADADSEFHPQYYEALTYQFVHAGGKEDETPSRYLSIWQPPIVHYKNYLTQPVIVRLASLFTSQHELANLADPNAVRVPYSTYSISATLAKAVKGWDPDWISEDWHMGIKCFLATAGRIRIQPIFLGVMNYAPEGETYAETVSARWTQAKRHALGFSELVFFQDHFPRVLGSIDGRWHRLVFVWRAFFLWSRCLLIHLTMATMLVIGPMTALLIAQFLKNQMLEDVNSWTFLTYLVFQSTGALSVVLFMFTNVLLYELTQSRIDGSGSPRLPIAFCSRGLHFLYVMVTSLALMPFFFLAGGIAEWIAAIKTARTHEFQYEVAPKPNLGGKEAAASA